MESQQFHLKWNNHSLNTLNSFQHLLDTCCLVDVSLTCASGKVLPAHRMVLAACSDYFYRLFKDLPEKHPVIVFKDASEQILNDLLEFMYRGEVEVDEANLSDFLKFADTLQVKGLSQGQDGAPASSWKPKDDDIIRNGSSNTASPVLAMASTPTPVSRSATPNNTTPRNTPPISVKDASKLTNPVLPQHPLTPPITSIPDSVANMNKAYHFTSALAAGLQPTAKFPNFFGLPNGDPTDIYSHLASPNLFNALKRKYPVSLGQKPGFPGALDPESSVLKMPFLKDYFGGKSPMDLSETARVMAASGYPLPNLNRSKDDDDIAERSPAPSESDCTIGGGLDDSKSDHLSVCSDKHSTSSGPTAASGGANGGAPGGGGRRPQGRGSRLERMIAAEYKILSEYNPEANGTPETLPAITPELMKSRRTHSLQLAIGEIMHNRASVQSAATKYHIPRETLRRHYQRYLKAMGINTTPGNAPATAGPRSGSAPNTPTKSSIETLAAAAAAHAAAAGGAANSEAAAAAYSSLLDIGQAYGIWGAEDSSSGHDLSRSDGKDEGDLRIVEDDVEVDDDSDTENKSQGGKMDDIDDSLSRLSKGSSPQLPSATALAATVPALPPQNNNNVAPEKPLTAPRPMPMEIA